MYFTYSKMPSSAQRVNNGVLSNEKRGKSISSVLSRIPNVITTCYYMILTVSVSAIAGICNHLKHNNWLINRSLDAFIESYFVKIVICYSPRSSFQSIMRFREINCSTFSTVWRAITILLFWSNYLDEQVVYANDNTVFKDRTFSQYGGILEAYRENTL